MEMIINYQAVTMQFVWKLHEVMNSSISADYAAQ